ncbi:hypothetical protein pah_c013o046 [Parachlamydia acanthamoebae str. Hall's coccus]|nr:hypothetical protein pah_c013o046 [Parachlamydia acanthamoebae str. Hall's coccus]
MDLPASFLLKSINYKRERKYFSPFKLFFVMLQPAVEVQR